MALSSGKSKNTDNLIRDVFLRIKNNKVSDVINVETKDFCTVSMKVSYNVEFVGDTDVERLKWFDDSNYVKLLCDRMKSRIRRAVKKLSIQEFYNDAAEVVIDTVLGSEGKVLFNENNMQVFDVEVSSIQINDDTINDLFERNQFDTIQKQLSLANSESQSAISEQLAKFDMKNANTKFEVESENLKLKQKLEEEKAKFNQFVLDKERDLLTKKLDTKEFETKQNNLISAMEREDEKQRDDAMLVYEERKNELTKNMIEANAKAFCQRMESITPKLVEALDGVAKANQVAEIAKSVAPYALAGDDESVADVVRKLTLNDSFENIMSMFSKKSE